MRYVLPVLALSLAALPACGHSYATPVVVVSPGSGDVAWIVQDASHVLRCTQPQEPPDARPLCVRAEAR